MEMEHISKQVEWLDEERRKDQTRLSSMEERLASLENTADTLLSQMKELTSELSRLNTLGTRMDGFTDTLQQARLENKKQVDTLEKQTKKRQDELEKRLNATMRPLEKSLSEMYKDLDRISELERGMETRIESETRLARQIDEARNRMESIRRSEEEFTRTVRIIEDGRRQDSKRMTDLMGEVTAIRKRVDDHRGKIELATAELKNVDTRVNELTVVEAERRETIQTFMDAQALRDVERDKVWKEWQKRFEAIEEQATDVEQMLQNLDATHRAVKRAQQEMEELTQKVERRINEITEIQRLAEERFRQEWVTFKADDQKRWTNYTLTTDEQRSEAARKHEKLEDKVTNLEDNLQENIDILQQVSEHTEKRLQTILSMAHEWVSSFERIAGHRR